MKHQEKYPLTNIIVTIISGVKIMNIEPNIVKLYENINEDIKHNQDLFKLNPATLICAQTAGGKTVLINNLLVKDLFDVYEPENIFIFSRTVFKDDSWKPYLYKLFEYDVSLISTNIFDKLEPIIKKIQEWDQQSKDGQQLENKLVIIDDFIGHPLIDQRGSQLSNYIPVCRHDKKFNKISTTIRQNSEQIFLGHMAAGLPSFIAELCEIVPKQKYMNMIYYVQKDHDYSFLIIRKDKPLKNGMFTKNWTEILNPFNF